MAVPAEKIYYAVKSGRVKVEDLNEESKQTLNSYVSQKMATEKVTAKPTEEKSLPQRLLYNLKRPGAWLLAGAREEQKMRQEGISPWSAEGWKRSQEASAKAWAQPETTPSGEEIIKGWGWEEHPGPKLPLIGTPREVAGGVTEFAADPLAILGFGVGGKIASTLGPKVAAKLPALVTKALAVPAERSLQFGTTGGLEAYAENKPVLPAAFQSAATGAVLGGAEKVIGGAAGKLMGRPRLKIAEPVPEAKPITTEPGPTDFVVDQFGNVRRPVAGELPMTQEEMFGRGITERTLPMLPGEETLALPPAQLRRFAAAPGGRVIEGQFRPELPLAPEIPMLPRARVTPDFTAEPGGRIHVGTPKPELPPGSFERMMNDIKPDVETEIAKVYLPGYRPSPQQLGKFVREVAISKGYDYDKLAAEARFKTQPQKTITVEGKKAGQWAIIVEKFDQMEQAARKRIKSRKGRVLSGPPMDDIADYTVIGAAKIAKGTVKFAQWSAEMVKEFGESIKPYLQQIYAGAKELHGRYINKEQGAIQAIGGIKEKVSEPAAKPKETPVGQQPPSEKFKGFKYVDTKPLKINILEDTKKTARDIRQEYSGFRHKQVVTGNQLAAELKKTIKNQDALQFYVDAGGDKNLIRKWLSDLDPKLDPYRETFKRALNLTPDELAAADKAMQYYREQGEFSKELGTISEIRDNYANRMWTPEPETDFIKTEAYKKGLSSYTSHKKQRVFDYLVDGIKAGKVPKTLNATDLLATHNEEMARANSNRMLTYTMQEAGLGGWVPAGDIPEGWVRIEGMEREIPTVKQGYVKELKKEAEPGEDWGPEFGKLVSTGATADIYRQVFAMPKDIAKGLKAITEGNFIKRIEGFAKLQKYQGIVKSVDLAYSTFHHIAMTAQMLYQGNVKAITSLPKLKGLMNSASFREMEQDFVRYTGMTSKVEANQDILRKLTEGTDVIAKVTRLPAFRQALKIAEANNEFLFGKLQRYLKVMDYHTKVAKWLGDNPNLTPEELVTAKRGIAKEINAAYGGLNWKALGVTPSMQSVLRLTFLAPDWTTSNILLFKYASPFELNKLSKKAALGHIVTALVGGTILTEGLNYLLTGHFTDKNARGHETEIEIQPGVYASAFRGGIGDALKLMSNVMQSGPQGIFRSIQGKLSPWARTLVGLLSNTDYLGRKIIKADAPITEDVVNFLKHVGSSALPVPFGISSTYRYVKEGKVTLPGITVVATGAGRFSNNRAAKKSKFAKLFGPYEGNWIRPFTAPPEEKAYIKRTEKLKKLKSIKSKLSEVVKDTSLAPEERRKQTAELIKQLKKALKD